MQNAAFQSAQRVAYGLDDQGLILGGYNDGNLPPLHHVWGPPSPLSIEYRGLYPWSKAAGALR
jgi:hypothetical protein